MVHTLIKNPSSTVQATKYPRWLRKRRQTRPQNPQTRALKNYNRNKPTCTLHGPGYDLNLCKAMWVKAKSMKANWSSARGGGGHGKFTSDKQHLGGGKEPNTLATSDMDKTNLNSKISLRLCRREIPTQTTIQKLFTFENQRQVQSPTWNKNMAIGSCQINPSGARETHWLKNSCIV